MGDFLKQTVRIGEREIPMWQLAAGAAGIALLLVLILTGEGPGTGSDWVTHNEG